MDWFATRTLDWWDRHGRKSLPWQIDRTPYRVWVSEVMLQQTQVTTVIPYFTRFVDRFPDIAALARADVDQVLHLWTGLGYYARGRNLHAAARRMVEVHAADVPKTMDELTALPGIGRSTAGAILSSAFGIRAPILDGNVKRVLARFHVESDVKALWRQADDHTPRDRLADYTQAIMDLGATVCVRSRPLCATCPVQERCAARAQNAVERYPARRARRELPIRQARMFVLVDPRGRHLLERRPTNGLWGGLWGPIERARSYSLEALLCELGASDDYLAESAALEVFRHTFTHFHLDIEPIRAHLSRPLLAIRDDDRFRWYTPGEDDAIGLFAPAVRLLQPTLGEPA